MTYCKSFTFSVILVCFFGAIQSLAQGLPECGIDVKAAVTDATGGARNGAIQLDFGSETSSKHLKVFISAPLAKVEWKEADENDLKGLHAGFYDILIVDTSKKECARQLTVEIKSK